MTQKIKCLMCNRTQMTTDCGPLITCPHCGALGEGQKIRQTRDRLETLFVFLVYSGVILLCGMALLIFVK